MPTYEELQALVAAAAERAATEVVTWIPEKPGDHIAGEVVEIGTISTKFGDYYTTTIRPVGPVVGLVDNERTAAESERTLIRIAWMGAVLKAQFDRMRPAPDDIVAFHYQKDVTPSNGMNDYALVVATVLDPTTGKAKTPVDLSVVVPTTEQVVNADPATGELPPAGFTPGVSPLEPRPGEVPFD